MTLKRQRGHGVIECWPTPLYCCQRSGVEGFNRRLASILRGLQEQDPGMQTANSGAWQSTAGLLRRDETEILQLREWIFEAVTTLARLVTAALRDVRLPGAVAEAWAVVHEDGHYHDLHTHSDAVWSGVYYVEAPESAVHPGVLTLVDPRPAARQRAKKPEELFYEVRPAPGLMVAFPAWLQHRVQPVRSAQPRICVAFNAGYDRDAELET